MRKKFLILRRPGEAPKLVDSSRPIRDLIQAVRDYPGTVGVVIEAWRPRARPLKSPPKWRGHTILVMAASGLEDEDPTETLLAAAPDYSKED